MTTAHTPGPWFLFGNGHCVGGPASDTETPTAGVAMCGMARRGPDESAANARLISAAPDMLAALRGLLASQEFSALKLHQRVAIVEAVERATKGAS